MLNKIITGRIEDYLDRLDSWLIIQLYKQGLRNFNKPKKIKRFLQKNKLEFEYDKILEVMYLLKDRVIIARFDERYSAW